MVSMLTINPNRAYCVSSPPAGKLCIAKLQPAALAGTRVSKCNKEEEKQQLTEYGRQQ